MAEPKTARSAPAFDEAPRAPGQKEYLVGRSRGERPFRRSGITFQPRWHSWRLDDLGPDRVRVILAEQAIQAQLATAEEARDIMDQQGPDAAARPASETEVMRVKLEHQDREIAFLKRQVAMLVDRSKSTPP